MPALQEQNLNARRLFETRFRPNYPRSFRLLQDMTLAAAKAVKHQGKVSIFGKDKGEVAFTSFMETSRRLVSTMLSEGATTIVPDQPNQFERINAIVKAFFVAYPNWEEAAVVWDGFAQAARQEGQRYN